MVLDVQPLLQCPSLQVAAPAKAGAIAPIDVFVPPGNTGLGPEKTSFFQALRITTKIARGTIEIIVSALINVHVFKLTLIVLYNFFYSVFLPFNTRFGSIQTMCTVHIYMYMHSSLLYNIATPIYPTHISCVNFWSLFVE